MEKILVTGVGGRVGQILTKGLSKHYRLMGVDKTPVKEFREGNPALKAFSEKYYVLNKNFFVADISVKQDVEDLFSKLGDIKKVLHLSAASSRNASSEVVIRDNINATANIFEASVDKNIGKIVYASSNGVYGFYEQMASQNGQPLHLMDVPPLFNEETLPSPEGAYSASKVWQEAYAKALYYQHQVISFIGLRLGVVRLNDNPMQVSAETSAPSVTDPVARLRRLWLYHEDLVQIVRLCLEKAERCKVYNAISASCFEPGVYIDTTKARRELGFNPKKG